MGDLGNTAEEHDDILSARSILRAAADLVEPEGKWIQGGLAGDRDGRPLRGAVTGADYCGHCWCIVGAIDKAWWLGRQSGETYHTTASDLAKDMLSKSLGMAPEYWNDLPGRTQTQAVSALRTASGETP